MTNNIRSINNPPNGDVETVNILYLHSFSGDVII